MSMCRVFSCVVGRGCLLWPVCSLGKTLLAFALLHSVLQGQMNSMKRQEDRTRKDELPRSVGAQNDMGDHWRNNFRKNEGMVPKRKQHPVVDMTGDWSKVRCCKEQYCIGTWNVRSINQGKLEVVKQEMAEVNIDILGISELKWTAMGEFNSDHHYTTTVDTIYHYPLKEMELPS